MANIITKSPYICAPNIMDTPDYKTKHVKLDLTGTDCIKAGSPINDEGKVANDESAIGILLYDCHACLGARRGVVVIDGRIKQDAAAEHSGITISDAAKAAMVNVSFTGDGSRMGGGSGIPFGDVKITEEEIQPECHPELMENNESFSRFFIREMAGLTVGETYIVNWNGVEYRCVAKAPDVVSYDAAPVYAILGNTAKMDETGDTGEPFVIRAGRYRDNKPSEYQIYAFDGATELTISIRHVVETIHKLSGKYVEGMGWSEKSTKEVLPETFVAEPSDQFDGFNVYPINCALEGGKKYTIIYNGVAYDVISVEDNGFIMAGNLGFNGGADTGEPFLAGFDALTGEGTVGTPDDGGITISISGVVETVHPIDKKYLGEFVVNLEYIYNNRYVADKTLDEIGGAVSAGKTVVLYTKTDDGMVFKYVQVGSGSEFVSIGTDDGDLTIDTLSYEYDEDVWVSRIYRFAYES